MSLAKRFVSRTVLAKVYANDKCARRLYSHSPVLPEKPYGPSDGSVWSKVTRPKPPEYIKGLVHYELAVDHDIQHIVDFWSDKIGGQSPLLQSIGAKAEEMSDLAVQVVTRSVKEHCSLLGFVGDELVGFSMHSIRKMEPVRSEHIVYPEILPSKNYVDEIENAPYQSRPAKKMWVFWHTLSSEIERLLPEAKKILFIEMGGVAPEYQQRGIYSDMAQLTIRLAKEKFDCDHVLVVADSKAAQKMYEQKLEFKLLRELKLDHFYDGETHAFPYMKNEIFSGKLLGKAL
ncbi:unnamed protein product [Bursaphelenchus okinawaensis]|uniref:N-acetyltransferase domain-containing protein n=1 Tax=Bursaphelenchus okinawaensis TaxID=465554 RepID=A0A811LDJ8_9BILA|nr:unnamed protein product [Bursaphelenchus okinawaensis]CAG9120477.1 unnamed protein product [Bursaphelenchus okinawaensis]